MLASMPEGTPVSLVPQGTHLTSYNVRVHLYKWTPCLWVKISVCEQFLSIQGQSSFVHEQTGEGLEVQDLSADSSS